MVQTREQLRNVDRYHKPSRAINSGLDEIVELLVIALIRLDKAKVLQASYQGVSNKPSSTGLLLDKERQCGPENRR